MQSSLDLPRDHDAGTCDLFLVVATPLDPAKGVTGATMGTKMLMEELAGRFEVRLVALRAHGLSGHDSSGGRLGRRLAAAWATLESLIALVGAAGSSPRYIYLVPAASLGGSIRDSLFVLIISVMFRNSLLILHIRNGNFFEPAGRFVCLLRRFVVSRAFRIFVLSKRLVPVSVASRSEVYSKFWMLPNTIDQAIMPRPCDRSAIFLPIDGPLRVLFFSNFIAEKGYWTLLEAAERLGGRGLTKQFQFSFSGRWLTKADRRRFLERAAALSSTGLAVCVSDGVADRAEARSLYASHHIFCLPSSYAAEAQPRSILEAMANGCAIVATRYRGIPDMVIDGENGLLIQRRDPELLADALERLLSLDVAAMQAASRRLFFTHFSPDRIRASLMEALPN